jgi:hypothetical protein
LPCNPKLGARPRGEDEADELPGTDKVATACTTSATEVGCTQTRDEDEDEHPRAKSTELTRVCCFFVHGPSSETEGVKAGGGEKALLAAAGGTEEVQRRFKGLWSVSPSTSAGAPSRSTRGATIPVLLAVSLPCKRGSLRQAWPVAKWAWQVCHRTPQVQSHLLLLKRAWHTPQRRLAHLCLTVMGRCAMLMAVKHLGQLSSKHRGRGMLSSLRSC